MLRTALSIILAAVVTGSFLFVPDASGQSPIQVRVTDELAFSPEEVRIKQGQSVRWVNTSSIVHTVTADPSEALDPAAVQLPDEAQAFDSGALDPGETFTRTFNQPGTYQYVCIVHEGVRMTGRVVVE